MNTPRTVRAAALVAMLLVTVFTVSAGATSQQLAAASCATANVLSGSNFEIDVNANPKVS